MMGEHDPPAAAAAAETDLALVTVVTLRRCLKSMSMPESWELLVLMAGVCGITLLSMDDSKRNYFLLLLNDVTLKIMKADARKHKILMAVLTA
jgi:hypothetical protein